MSPDRPSTNAPLDGHECFTGIDATVMDFWRFAMSDTKMNTVRGYLAEYLVHRAVGSCRVRTEWAGCDLITDDGIRVEVKAAGYMQSWGDAPTKRAPTWRIGPTLDWNKTTGGYEGPKKFQGDVYVFAMHTARTHQDYDALNVAQWEFYVLHRTIMEARPTQIDGKVRMSLQAVQQAAGEPVTFERLAERIRDVARHPGTDDDQQP